MVAVVTKEKILGTKQAAVNKAIAEAVAKEREACDQAICNLLIVTNAPSSEQLKWNDAIDAALDVIRERGTE